MNRARHKISIQSNFREFIYSAHISATGKLLRVTAGCRVWRNFAAARDHYRGLGVTIKWRDEACKLIGTWACREEARRILDRLENLTRGKIQRIKKARRRGRKN